MPPVADPPYTLKCPRCGQGAVAGAPRRADIMGHVGTLVVCGNCRAQFLAKRRHVVMW